MRLRGRLFAISKDLPTVTFTRPAGPIQPIWDFMAFNEDYALYYSVGTMGTAKTDALMTAAIKTMLDYPGCTIVIARADLQVLKRTTMDTFLKKCEEINVALGGEAIKHNKNDSVVAFPEINGRSSRAYFFGLMTGDYERKLKSLEPFRVYIDEANEIHEHVVDMAIVRCRAKVRHRDTGALGRVHLKMAANDKGHNWLWRKFVNKPHPGQLMDEQWAKHNLGPSQVGSVSLRLRGKPAIVGHACEVPDGRRATITKVIGDAIDGDAVVVTDRGTELVVAVPELTILLETVVAYSFSHQNWSLNQENLLMFELVSQSLRDQYLYGRIDIRSGLLTPEFTEDVHILPSEDIPPTWGVVVGVDHGLDHPTSAVYCALSPSGDVIVFDEYEASNLAASSNAYNILKQLPRKGNVYFYGDPAMWQRNPSDPQTTIASTYKKAGCNPFRKADNRRDFGIDLLKDMLTLKYYGGYKEPRPKLYVMDNCYRLIERLLAHTYEESKRKINDDLVDALRYAVTAVADVEYMSSAPSEDEWNVFDNQEFSWLRR